MNKSKHNIFFKNKFYNQIKFSFVAFFVTIFSFNVFSANSKILDQNILPKNFKEYTLENSMKVFVLEDFSCAPVRIEFSVRAGFSAQTPKTAGFFPLYANLFIKSGIAATGLNSGNFLSECNADACRFVINVSPEQVEQTIQILSAALFTPVITDVELEKEFSALKESVKQNAFSTAGFINSSIDSRIFAEAPWKQDSGIYPAIFSQTSIDEARTILSNIAQIYYVPQNSAIFISGGISNEKALEFTKKYFKKKTSKSTGNLSDNGFILKSQNQKKFVLHDKLLSPEMSQIVIQYTNFSMTQADIASAVLNKSDSTLKNQLFGQEKLSIRDKEYINVAAAHKNGSSRLIFQSLLETNENATPVEQSELFLQIVKSINFEEKKSKNPEKIFGADLGNENIIIEENKQNFETSDSFQSAKDKLIAQFLTRFKNSSDFMELMSQFWAITPVKKMYTESTSQELTLQPKMIQYTTEKTLSKIYKKEEPYVFILVNSDVFQKNQENFKKAGYEEINVKNGSWYSQNLYEELKNSLAIKNPQENSESESVEENLLLESAKKFAEVNSNLFSSFRLSNEIPVIIKKNENATTAVISLAISGGKLSTLGKNVGLSEVLSNALSQNIQFEISKRVYEKLIFGDPEVLSQTNLAGSIITVECLAQDVEQCLEAISKAIIFGQISPAMADGLVYNTRRNHRMEISSPTVQLFRNGVKFLYGENELTQVYTLQDDILSEIDYLEILANYPEILDAAKYSLVLTGNVPENLTNLLEENFGILANQTKNDFRLYHKFPEPDFSNFVENSVEKVQIAHKFIVDTSTPAGPFPGILIPTKNFSDPAQFWIKSPSVNSEDFVIFNAILYELEERLNSEIKSNKKIEETVAQIELATAEIQAGIVNFSKVEHTQQIEEIYEKVVQNLFNSEQDEKFVETVKNRWILKELAKTQTNRGTAILMRNGLEAGNFTKNNENNKKADIDIQAAMRYVKEYEIIANANTADFSRVANEYFSKPILKLFSKDSKN